MKDIDKTILRNYLESEEGQEILLNVVRKYAIQLKERFDIDNVSRNYFRLTAQQDDKRSIIISYPAFKRILKEMTSMNGNEVMIFISKVKKNEIHEISLSALEVGFEPAIVVMERIYLQTLDELLEFQQLLYIFKNYMSPYFHKFLNDKIKDEQLFKSMNYELDKFTYDLDSSELNKQDRNIYRDVLKKWKKHIRLFHVYGNLEIDKKNKEYMKSIYFFYEKLKNLEKHNEK